MSDLCLTYMGAAGWRFGAGPAHLLVDPYFTRLSMRATLFGRAIPDVPLISRSTPLSDAILVTHPHHDHLMDVPEVARITGAPVYVSPQGADLLELLGVPPRQIYPIDAEAQLAIGPFEVKVYPTPHRLIFGQVPYYGPLRSDLTPPLRAADYRMDVQYSFGIMTNGLRILLASGICDEPDVPADVLIIGADATRDQLARVLSTTRPFRVLPNHWDDMFIPLDRPARPMITPPPEIIPSFRRIDLSAFARTVRELRPGCEVILPERGRPYWINQTDH